MKEKTEQERFEMDMESVIDLLESEGWTIRDTENMSLDEFKRAAIDAYRLKRL